MDDSGKADLIGRTLAHYRIQSAIGAGGMGEVYRATDTKLGRDVALKVLPPDMSRDPDRLARFQREARAVAALNHPNVVTLYSVEESDNVHFITMELIEGQPLDRLISANGLPADRIIEIAGAVAEALAAAHEKGIVHRDLKPANVMVTNEGRVKVLDFGLAKDVGAETANDATLTSAGRTQAGMVMGTPAYMSPEQVSGRPLDHRTDIFSLGVLLHEMATGRRPFEGTSSAELVSSILRDSPPSVTDARPELPSDLARVIRRCLEKDPRHRMQTARDVSNEFRDMARTTKRSVTVSTSSTRATAAADSGTARADEGFWVAVLPFKYGGNNADLMALSEGLSEEVITGLSRFSYLKVIARSSTARYAGQSVDVRSASKELNARYVMEGTLRQAGSRLRLAVQLVDTVSGAHLWAENYERLFSPEAVFELQDDLVPRIVSTVADINGVLPRSLSEAVRQRAPEQLTPYEAVLRSFGYFDRVTAEELNAAMAGIKSAVEKAPTYADAWAMLALLSVQRYAQGFGREADALTRGAEAARKAVEAAPANHLAWFSLSQVLFFQREFPAFRNAAERALALNPMDSNSLAFHGEMLAYSGEWERGLSLAERARQLNPHHPAWYWHVNFNHAYRQRDYRAALDIAGKMNQTGNWGAHLLTAAACGQVGDQAGAARALREVLKLRPSIASAIRADADKWFDAEHAAHLLEGLRKAGLEIPAEGQTRSPAVPASSAIRDSGAARAALREDEGFWIAVLPFKYKGADSGLEGLADSLTEEVITGLSRFSYLRVIARGSTAKYSRDSGDLRAISKELGARYVMEGSLRQAGSTIRLATQLVDATTGATLWAETFERAFRPDEIFALQDQLVPRIVSTVADQHGVLPRSISAAIRKKNDDQVTPYEAVFRVFSLHEKMTEQDHAACRDLLERMVRDAPDAADCWAMLATLYADEDWFGFNLRPDALGRAAAAAQKAADLGPASVLASQALAQSLFMRHEWQAFRPVAERTIALNPMDGAIVAVMGLMLACSGDWERGCAVADSAMRLHPNFPGWYWLATVFNAYRTGDYRAALDAALRIQMPGYFWDSVTRAAAYGQLGDLRSAQKALRELLAAKPDFAKTARQELEKWFEPELAGHFLEGLTKAGLEDAAGSATPAGSSGAVRTQPISGPTRADEGFWVAVLPFKCVGGSADLAALAEGLTDDIVTGMSKFSYLRVVARTSTARYAKQAVDVRTAAKELGARYVMEGSIRQAGAKLRIAVQLVDAVSGAGLWAETYDRAFSPETTLDLLDDVVPRIVATISDTQGILVHSMTDALRNHDPETLTPHEAVLRSFGYYQRTNATEHLAARTALEHAVKQPPDRADCWATLAWLYREEYTHGFNLQPDPLGRALAASRRALDADPTNHLAHTALAPTLFFLHDVPGFRAAAERAIILNPLEGYSLAYLGMLIAYSGDWQRGCALADRAMQLNPNHPGWYWFPRAFDAYRQGDYRGALGTALRVNLPGFWRTQLILAVANGQLGERVAAGIAVQELLKIKPDFAITAREELKKWYQDELIIHLIEGLRKAGLEIPDADSKPAPSGAQPARTASGASRANEGFWVAVLPFKYTGSNTDLKGLAEGLSEEVITGLSRFSYLRVIARGSTAKYSSESGDIRSIGKELGARYVMEGGLRQSGSKLRLAVQLVDATTGAHLWAETYERAFTPESVFEIQDDLVPRIVSTVADQHGVLPRSMSEVLRSKSEGSLTPHEAALRGFSYFTRLTREEHATIRRILEKAVREAPDQADCWAMLALMYIVEYSDGFNALPNPLDRALAAAQRAVDVGPTHALGHYALAFVYFFRKEKAPFRAAVEQTLAINPMDGTLIGLLGLLLHHSGDEERGLQLVKSAMQLNPNYPGLLRFTPFSDAYCHGRYAEALEAAVRINMPGFFYAHASRAAALGQLGQHEAARKAVAELLAFRPDFASAARLEYSKWYEPEKVELFIEGLRKAGLEIPDEDSDKSESQPPLAKSNEGDQSA